MSTLKKAHVNSVTCFGRGHHGYIYFNTEKFPERRHTHLKRNLLNEQIEVCHQFDILDSQSDFARYKVLILSDVIQVNQVLAEKINAFQTNGGALIASYKSGLNPAAEAFALKLLGVQLVGEAPFNPDFILPEGTIGKQLSPTEHVMYLRGLEVKLQPGTQQLAPVVIPYFNRTYEHFCSHRHTPSAGKVGYPGIVRNGRVIYFAHPIFTQYHENAPRWCKQLFLNVLEMLLPNPVVKVEGPSTLLVTVNEQAQLQRWVLHLLNYIPERRGADFDVLEDVIPIFNIPISIKAPKKVKSVAAVPQATDLQFAEKNGRVEFVLPQIEGHQMVEVRFI